MKTTVTLLMFLVLLLPNTPAQEDTQLFLPEGAVARFGKGFMQAIQYSPDGARFAVDSTTGIWLYDTTTYRAVALLASHTAWLWSIGFSPDSTTVAGGSRDHTVRLWDAETGESKRILTGHTETVDDVAFSSDGKLLASGSWDGSVLLWKVTDYGELDK